MSFREECVRAGHPSDVLRCQGVGGDWLLWARVRSWEERVMWLAARKLGALGLVLICLVFVLVLEGGHISQIIQATAIVGVIGLTALTSVAQLGAKNTLGCYLWMLTGSTWVSVPTTALAEFRRVAPTWSMHASNLCAVLGIIRVMSVLNDPSLIGEGIAVAFVSYVYGSLQVLFIGGTAPNWQDAPAQERPESVAAMVPGLGLMMLFMTIMYAISEGNMPARNAHQESENKTQTSKQNTDPGKAGSDN
jgi:hypothetical protein